MLIIAEVTYECALTGHFKSWDEWVAATPVAQSGQMPQDMQEEFKAIFDRLTPDCSYINAKAPGDSGDWYKKAAAAGNIEARLFRLWAERPSEANRRSMAVLLNDSMAPSDARFDFIASQFLVKYPIPADSTIAESWTYLGCAHDPACDAIGMRYELESRYLPAQVDDIVEQAQQIEQGSTPLDFLEVSSFGNATDESD